MSTRSRHEDTDGDFVNESESGESSGEEAEIESESDGDISDSDFEVKDRILSSFRFL